jgi:hypothetical protein
MYPYRDTFITIAHGTVENNLVLAGGGLVPLPPPLGARATPGPPVRHRATRQIFTFSPKSSTGMSSLRHRRCVEAVKGVLLLITEKHTDAYCIHPQITPNLRALLSDETHTRQKLFIVQ